MEENKIYGDEELGYNLLARDMTPEEAKYCLEVNMNDGIYMQMPHGRRVALHKRAEEMK